MTVRELPGWPPVWIAISGRPAPRGEVGVLRSVEWRVDLKGTPELRLTIEPYLAEMRATLAFFRRLAYEIPWSASLCTTALIEAEVVEVSQTVGQALTKHYGCRPEWGAMNYLVHEEVEREEAGETEGAA